MQAFQIQCSGANKNGSSCFLADEEKEPVIIKVYENGLTVPLCRYAHISDSRLMKCNPNLQEVSGAKEDKLGDCPYSTK